MNKTHIHAAEMHFDREIGLCGHPGLAADIYSFPISRPGFYRFETTTSQVKDYNGVAEIRVIRVDANFFNHDLSNRQTGISIESHGGAVISERIHLSQMRDHFDNAEFARGSDNEALWNLFANGFSSIHIEQVNLPSDSTSHGFAFFPCDEYLAATPLVNDNEVCGYLFHCRCDLDGNILPAPIRSINKG